MYMYMYTVTNGYQVGSIRRMSSEETRLLERLKIRLKQH